MMPEDRLEDCPWSCAIEHPGLHGLLGIEHEKAAEAIPWVLALAHKHGLVCFDP